MVALEHGGVGLVHCASMLGVMHHMLMANTAPNKTVYVRVRTIKDFVRLIYPFSIFW
jgi:hypothetical protein